MLSIGWTEMMIVAAFALIVVGPKDLPGMLRQIGKAVGSVRRMGNDFKAELNKVTAVDELKDIKKSIAAPMTDVRRDIEKEFNSIAPTGEVIPSGKISPKDADAQSVAKEIKAAAGIEDAGGDEEEPDPGQVQENDMGAVKQVQSEAVEPLPKPVRKVPVKAKSATPKKTTASKKPAAKRKATKKPVADEVK